MKFLNLKVGDRFFDNESGEFWIKVSKNEAKLDSNEVDVDWLESSRIWHFMPDEEVKDG